MRVQPAGSLPGRPLVEPLLSEDVREVVCVEAVDEAGAGRHRDGCNRTIAVVVAWRGVVEDAKPDDRASVGSERPNLHDLVTVERNSSVSIMHDYFFFLGILPLVVVGVY